MGGRPPTPPPHPHGSIYILKEMCWGAGGQPRHPRGLLWQTAVMQIYGAGVVNPTAAIRTHGTLLYGAGCPIWVRPPPHHINELLKM